MTKKKHNPHKRPLEQEIEETAKLDQYERVGVGLRILRSLYLHGLHAMKDGDYGSFSGLVEDLLRRDKHLRNSLSDAPLGEKEGTSPH